MDNLKLGQIITTPQQRDAIHIAVAPVVAGAYLSRGAQIGFAHGSSTIVLRKEACYGCEPVGIVDPFLSDHGVEKGQQFWMFLFPGTITGLRHEWAHPAFDARPATDESELWLHQFADRWNFDYREMIAGAQENEGYVVARGIDLHSAGELDGDDVLFWQHLENVTGRSFDQTHRENFGWSCSC